MWMRLNHPVSGVYAQPIKSITRHPITHIHTTSLYLFNVCVIKFNVRKIRQFIRNQYPVYQSSASPKTRNLPGTYIFQLSIMV